MIKKIKREKKISRMIPKNKKLKRAGFMVLEVYQLVLEEEL